MVALGGDNKKNLYILGGLAGVLGILVLVVVKPFGGGSSPEASPTPAPTKAGSPAAPGAGPGAPGAPTAGLAGSAPAAGGPKPGGTGTGDAGPTAQVVALPIAQQPSRLDPFTPYYAPTLPPPPPPPVIPAPVPIPSPNSDTQHPLLLPAGFSDDSGALQPLHLPPVQITQFQARSAPQNLSRPVAVGADDRPVPLRSPDKRLSGVIIGDSISALLEISDGQQTTTRVVQPGDEVDGIKILRIGRVDEDGVQTMRMYVLENDQERFFDLRAAPQQTGGANGAGGAPAGGALGGITRGAAGPPPP